MEVPDENEWQQIVEFFLCKRAENRLSMLLAFKTLYAKQTHSPAPLAGIFQVDESIVSSHLHLRQLVQKLQEDPTITRQRFQETAFARPDYSPREFEYAIKTIVQLAYMLDCSLLAPWGPLESFDGFVRTRLPKNRDPEYPYVGFEYKQHYDLRAYRLRKRCRIKFEATNNISDHLMYDPDSRSLKIFHQIAYLHAQLERSSELHGPVGLSESLKSGNLPRQLIIEVLESFYRILFPIDIKGEKQSRKLLARLIDKRGFDALTLTGSHYPPPSSNFEYIYFDGRLKDLIALKKKPPPVTRWMSWLEERTSERNALMIAIVGLFLSAFFGLVGCIIGAAQLWYAALTWKAQEST